MRGWASGQASGPSQRMCGWENLWAGERIEWVGNGRTSERACIVYTRVLCACVCWRAAGVWVDERAGEQANTCSVRMVRDGWVDGLRTRGFTAVRYDKCHRPMTVLAMRRGQRRPASMMRDGVARWCCAMVLRDNSWEYQVEKLASVPRYVSP